MSSDVNCFDDEETWQDKLFIAAKLDMRLENNFRLTITIVGMVHSAEIKVLTL